MRKNTWWSSCLVALVFPVVAGCGGGESTLGPQTNETALHITVPQIDSRGGGVPIPPPGGIVVGDAERSLVYVWADRGSGIRTGAWSLDIPAYSLSRNKVVGLWSIPWMPAGLPEHLGIEAQITPGDLVFNTPATLTFSYLEAGITLVEPEDLAIYVFDESAMLWVPCVTVLDTAGGNISTTVTGDSRYALGVVRGGI